MTQQVTREEAVAAYREITSQMKFNHFAGADTLFRLVKEEIKGLDVGDMIQELVEEGSYYDVVMEIIARCSDEVEEEEGAACAYAFPCGRKDYR